MTRNVGSRGWAVVLTAATAMVAMAVPASAQSRQSEDHADTNAVLDRYLAEAGPGTAVYAGNRAGSWNLHNGTANIASPDLPIEPTDHFRAASQTKTFTAAVVLQLVDEGKVVLDAPIERYLPGVVDGNGYDGNKITVRQILQHTAGIPDAQPTAYVNVIKPDGTIALRDLVGVGLSQPPLSEPGAKFEYSNVDYHIAGLMIEQITGGTVADAVTSRIIRPLGLTRTRFPQQGDSSLGTPYVPGYRGVRVGPFAFWTETTFGIPGINVDIVSAASSAGAVVSTLTDLTAFFRALFDGRVISPAALAEMRRTVPIPGGLPGYAYGLGIQRQVLSCGGEAWGHPGDMPTGHSSLTVVTDDGRYAAVMTNAMALPAAAVEAEVADSALCGSR